MYEKADCFATPGATARPSSGEMTLQEVKDRLVQIQRVHSDGIIPTGPGLVSRENDPELRAIAVALGLDRLLRDIRRAIHTAGESRS